MRCGPCSSAAVEVERCCVAASTSELRLRWPAQGSCYAGLCWAMLDSRGQTHLSFLHLFHTAAEPCHWLQLTSPRSHGIGRASPSVTHLCCLPPQGLTRTSPTSANECNLRPSSFQRKCVHHPQDVEGRWVVREDHDSVYGVSLSVDDSSLPVVPRSRPCLVDRSSPTPLRASRSAITATAVCEAAPHARGMSTALDFPRLAGSSLFFVVTASPFSGCSLFTTHSSSMTLSSSSKI